MTDSQQLLAEYTAKHSETAFRELVGRYIDLVYSTAVRLVDGDAHRAEDVAQTVFLDLSRMAGRLSPQTMLGGWLHRHTCFVARTLMRGERRRQVRERQAMELSALNHHADPALTEISSVLDEAIQELGADDRDAILLRFFEHRNLRSVGEALGTSENVAQKRVARALQELSTLLRRRGYGLPAAALATGLAAGAVTAAPAGLASSVAGAVFAGAGGATAANVAVAAKLKAAIVGALVVGAVVTGVFLRQPSRAKLPEPSVAVQQQVDSPEPASLPEPAPVAAEPAISAPIPPLQKAPRVPVARPPVATRNAEAALQPVKVAVPVPETGIAGPDVPGYRLFAARPGSKMTIHGTANILHTRWLIESSFIGGMMEVGPEFPTEPGQAATLGKVEARANIFIQVRSLKSIEEDGRPYSDHMDDIMYQQLKEDQFKQITYTLEELTLKEVPKPHGAPYVFEAIGALGVAGVTNRITMTVSILPVGKGRDTRLEITGKTVVKTTDYGVSPVDINLVVGHIKTGEEVTLTFKWVVGVKKGASMPVEKGMVPLILDLPEPAFKGIPKDLQLGPNVEALWIKPRPAMMVPAGLENIAPEAHIACSDRNVPADALAKLTDGDKAGSEQSSIFLRKGTQCVELDFERPQQIFAIVIWHAHNAAKVYHDVVVQTTDGPDFSQNVRTLFNNDRDNSSGLGVGTNREYIETHEGKLIDAKGVKARFIRFYSNGSTESALNEYTEIEVYGRPAW